MDINRDLLDEAAPIVEAKDLVRSADRSYEPFPSFVEWTAQTSIDRERWEARIERFEKVRESVASEPERLQEALQRVRRAAAIETGAIEGLYEHDRGFTITAFKEVAVFDAALNARDPKTRDLIKAQLDAYDLILDFVTQQQPLAEAWIRELHTVLARAQKTYKVLTSAGVQEQELPLGQYKRQPNHVWTQQGTIHSYAPVEMVAPEMHRFVEEIRTQAFDEAHCVVQAAYAHYVLTAIHPFIDGNGRVARALASVFTMRDRDLGVPLLITNDQRGIYFAALAEADRGNYQPFVDFVLERVYDVLDFLQVSFRTTAAPSSRSIVETIKQRYVTRAGYTHQEVDAAGNSLFQKFEEELNHRAKSDLVGAPITFNMRQEQKAMDPPRELQEMRRPVAPPQRRLRVSFTSRVPATGSGVKVERLYTLFVPRNAAREDRIVLYETVTREVIPARIGELLPTTTISAEIILRLAAEGAVQGALLELDEKLQEAMRAAGY
ncbi:MAG TPA: Fic family protein [Ardenticatenaceae bacterium]|jgi:Fic family protein